MVCRSGHYYFPLPAFSERDSGTELEEHLAEFHDMARSTDSVVPGARVVVNEDRTLRDVAIEVMRIAEWIS